MRRKKKLAVLMAAVLACCLFLSGCAVKNETLDAQLDRTLAALNQDDREAFFALLYPGLESNIDLDEGYRQIREIWIPTERENVELVRYNVNASPQQKAYQGIYRLPRSDEFAYLEIDYLETKEGRGLVGLHMGMIEEPEQKTYGVGQWINIVLYAAFVLFTVVDVIRKKPRKYGWYIVLALLYFRLRINSFSVSLPLGSIIYWCIRKKLLREKEAAAMTPAAPSEPLAPDAFDAKQDDQNQN